MHYESGQYRNLAITTISELPKCEIADVRTHSQHRTVSHQKVAGTRVPGADRGLLGILLRTASDPTNIRDEDQRSRPGLRVVGRWRVIQT